MDHPQDTADGLIGGQPVARPFKVASVNGVKRVGLVASTLQELKDKGRDKLGLAESSSVNVVLESDATEVEDEDYFSFLEPQTAFVLLAEDEKYIPPSMRDRIDGLDETDSAPPELTGDPRLDELIQALRLDLTKIVMFSPDELQSLLSMDQSILSSVLDMRHGPGTADQVISACQRFLDEHQQARDFVSLLDLLRTRGTSTQTQDGNTSKRKREQEES